MTVSRGDRAWGGTVSGGDRTRRRCQDRAPQGPPLSLSPGERRLRGRSLAGSTSELFSHWLRAGGAGPIAAQPFVRRAAVTAW